MTEHRDPFDDALAGAARDYNRPPASVPRDRMWDSIRAQRAARAATSRKTSPSWRRIALAAAAVLVLGITIGRVYERLAGGHPASAVASTTAAPYDSADVAGPVPDTNPATAAPAQRVAAGRSSGGAPGASALPPTGRDTAARERTLDSGAPGAGLGYRLAVVQHLAGTEAMLTAFRVAAQRGTVDPDIPAWARRLVRETRLLAAAPAAASDPVMQRLLDDLELVLVQIANYTPSGPNDAQSLEIIEHSIERRNVIPKLRATVPAGFRSAGT